MSSGLDNYSKNTQQAKESQEYSGEEYDSEDYQSGDERGSGNVASGDNQKAKHRRRSKNDNEGRKFRCGGCDKRYLSYPALYTHIKQKHDSVTPEGTNNASVHSGRGRGRPRKERKENHAGEVVNHLDKLNINSNSEDTINAKLSKQLTEEIIHKENADLSKIPFIVKSSGDSSSYTALTWYVENPSERDELYQTTVEVIKFVEECQRELKEHENKSISSKGAGISTQYLLMIPDE